MPDIKIDDNGMFEEERRLNACLNSNKLEQLENQHVKIDKRWNVLLGVCKDDTVEGRFVLMKMRVLNRSRQNDRLRVMTVLVHIAITPLHTPMPVSQRIGERTIPYSWRTCKQLRHLVGCVS
ncbi:uncharacterized protein TNCV_477301 [Trichonephila clavipes]|nr:uncharacterized protein TNCV_477301 [Trichonephila clavipes]